MSVPVGSRPRPGFINALLSENFANMEKAGPAVLRPFLQVRAALGWPLSPLWQRRQRSVPPS